MALQQSDTLRDAAARFLLNDTNLSSDAIAQHLGLQQGRGDAIGEPGCCFFQWNGLSRNVVTIRVAPNEVVIFLLYERLMAKMEEIATRIRAS